MLRNILVKCNHMSLEWDMKVHIYLGLKRGSDIPERHKTYFKELFIVISNSSNNM